MTITKLTQLKREMFSKGALHFFNVKITEQFYKYKFRRLSVNYQVPQGSHEMVKGLAVNKDARMNQASSYYDIRNAFACTKMDYTNIRMIDIGCGNGKVLNFGMWLNFKEVIGFDLDEAATKKATDNCEKLKQKGFATLFSVLQGDAAYLQIPENINLVYLFNPFGKSTMEHVVDNIIHYITTNKRELFVVYTVPVHQDLFLAHKEFSKIYERMDGVNKYADMAIFKANAQ